MSNDIPVVINMPLLDEPGPVDKNGWRLASRWRYHNGGQWGEDAIAGFTMYYEKPGTDLKGEISYYVEPCRTENLPEVRDAYHVEMYWEAYRREGDDGETIDIDSGYDYGSVLYYDTFESAWKEAERLSKMDESNVWSI